MNKRVLIVDDDASTCQLLAEVLAEFGVETIAASTDEEGYRRYLELGPDLIFIDVLLPRKGGIDLLRRIRSVRGGRDVPVFVMSAVYRGGDIRAQSVDELGALEFLKKPFQLGTLRQRLAQVLGDVEEEQDVLEPFPPVDTLSRGNLGVVELPLLLKDLALHETSGCLKLRSGKVKKILYLEDGAITFAASNQLRETLGRHLLESGKIDDQTYRGGLEAMRTSQRKMGEHLVESGALSAGELAEAVRQNVLDKVLEVFTWPDGDFQLVPPAPAPAVLPGQPFDALRVLWGGVRGPFPLAKIKQTLAGYKELYILPQRDLFELASEVPLEKEDLQFLRIVRRLRDQPLGQITAEAQGADEIRFLYYLLLRGYLALGRSGSQGRDGRILDATDLDRIRRARRRLDTLRSRNHFQVLEVPLETSDEQVRAAYLQHAKDCHPDMLSPSDPQELVKIYSEMFRAMQAAYETLKSESRRREYLRFLQEGIEEQPTDGAKILEAEERFQEGRQFLKRRDWNQAAEAFADALALNPDEGEYALDLGLARMRQASSATSPSLADAEQLFQRARELMPASPEPHYRLGRLATRMGDSERAATFFRAALACNPNHLESLRELRLSKMRNGRGGGGLAGLLGRKERR
ncbi:MAG: response regulator [Deferrisomatales bacterium]|nr:response regulator [Deferrisomatales bacterium]